MELDALASLRGGGARYHRGWAMMGGKAWLELVIGRRDARVRLVRAQAWGLTLMVVGCLYVDGARGWQCCGLHERNGLIWKMREKKGEVP